MIKAILNKCFLAVLVLAGPAALGQESARPAAPEDPRVEQLMKQDPATLVSEASYERGWPPLLESNISWKSRVWRTIDPRDGINTRLSDIGPDHSSLAAVLIKGVLDGKYKVYPYTDDHFAPSGMTMEAFRTVLTNDTT